MKRVKGVDKTATASADNTDRIGESRSVLQDWVMKLPLRAQGTLLTAVRGCDLTPKEPLNSEERYLVACIRCAFMVPADERETGAAPGCFMIDDVPVNIRWSKFGHYPQHWVAHIIHAIEVLGYWHGDIHERGRWLCLYEDACKALHVNPETFKQFTARMNEDRVAKGNIVS